MANEIGCLTTMFCSSGPGIDPKDVFMTANIFSNAVRAVRDKGRQPGFEQLDIPAVVMSAFTFELLLKCLIRLEGGKPKRGHKLDELFGQLSEESQKRIREMSQAAVKDVAQHMYVAQAAMPDALCHRRLISITL